MIASASALTDCGSSQASSFCSRIETGSSVWMTVGSITTQMGVRFGEEIFNNVDVVEYAPGIPTQGSVSAFIKGNIREDNQTTELNDFTSISGKISTFSKHMKYFG